MNKAIILLVVCIFGASVAGSIEDYQDRLIVSNLKWQQWYGVFNLSSEGVTKLHQVAFGSSVSYYTLINVFGDSGLKKNISTDHILIGTLLPVGQGFNDGSRLIRGTGLLEVYLEDGDTKYHIDACIYSKIFSGAYVNLVTPAHIAGLISGPDITC